MGKFERKEKSQPKHKPAASSGASKAPRPPPVQQPGWKGPTYLHKKPARPKPSSTPAASDAGPKLQPQALPAELQQLLLDVFRDTFPASLDFDALKPTLQEINTAISERDFEKAFGSDEFREAYAIRWSPSRALCYANLLADIVSSVASDGPWAAGFLAGAAAADGARRRPRAVCIGGGASEAMAFGALLRHAKPETAGKPSRARASATASGVAEGGGPCASLQLTLVDGTAAAWASVVAKLERGLTTAPALSKYASATARASNASLLGAGAMRVVCRQVDVLASTGVEELQALIGPDAALITLLFTLNDLYTASIPKTTKFLVEMSIVAPRGSLLLVVDGVRAKTAAAGEEGGKQYPMAWLMDHLLLGKGTGKTNVGGGEEEEEEEEESSNALAWEKLVGDECRLFRLDERLEYPASLENMRYQVHLFRRL